MRVFLVRSGVQQFAPLTQRPLLVSQTRRQVQLLRGRVWHLLESDVL